MLFDRKRFHNNLQKRKKESLELLFWIGTCVFFIAVFTSALFLQNSVQTASPPTILTYQGKLLNAGDSVTSTQSITFTIHDNLTGGSILYAASGTTAVPLSLSITPSSGIFAVNLGATSTNSIDPTIFQNYSDLYLEVAVDTTTLTPRKRITSVPFSINSKYLSGVAATSTASTTTYIPVSASDGSFTFNTTTFNKDLTVDSGILYVDSLNDRVGLNSTTPNANYLFTVSGTSYFDGTTTIADTLTISGRTGKPTHVLNIADTGSRLLGGANSIAAAGDYIYVGAQNDDAISVINIADPDNPIIEGTIANGQGGAVIDRPESLEVHGNYLYSIDLTGDSFSIYDVSQPSSIDLVGTLVDTEGGAVLNNPKGMSIQGNYAYIAVQTSDAFEVIDISDPTKPAHVYATSSAMLDSAKDVYVKDNYAYVVASGSSDSLQIFDISNPTAPVHVGSLADGTGGVQINTPNSIVVRNNLAFIAVQTDNALTIVDVSDPSSPVKHAEYDDNTNLSTFEKVEVLGNYAYAAADSEFTIIDLTSSTNPQLAGVLQHGESGAELDNAKDIEIVGNYAFIPHTSAGVQGVAVVSLGGLDANTAKIGAAYVDKLLVNQRSKFQQGVSIRGGLTVGAEALFSSGVSIAAASSTLTSTSTLAFSHRSVITASSSEGYVFSLQSKTQLADANVLFRLQNSSTDKFTILGNGYVGVGGTTTPNHALAVSGTTFISGTTTVSDVLNIQGKTSAPRHLSKTPHNGLFGPLLDNVQDIVVRGDFAYVVANDSNSLQILDIANPHALGQTTFLSDGTNGAVLGGAQAIALQGNYAYIVSNEDDALQIVDISTEASLKVRGSMVSSTDVLLDGARSIAVRGNYAYIASTDDDALYIIDVTDPDNPVEAGKIVNGTGGALLDEPQSVVVQGNYAYVAASSSNALEIVDITDPTNPIHAGSALSDGILTLIDAASDVAVQGNYAYVTGYDSNALTVIDISNKATPVAVGAISSVESARLINATNVFVSGDYAYVAGGTNANEFSVIDISKPAPKFVTYITDGDNNVELSGISSIFVQGNYAYVGAATDDTFQIIDISGTNITNAQIGTARVYNLTTDNDAEFGQDVRIRGGLSTGGNAFFGGELSLTSASSTLTSTNTVSFSHRAVFSASSTNGYAYTFQTRNTLTDSDVLFRLQNSSTTDRLTVLGNGYVGIGGTTTPNHALAVSGTAFVDGAATLSSNLTVGSGVLYVEAATTIVGVNTTTPLSGYNLVVSGTSFFSGTTTIKEKLSVEGYANQPRHLNQFSSGSITNGIQTMELRGDYAYIGADSASAIFSILDISNPHIPKVLGSVVNSSKMEGITDIALKGNYAYIAASSIDALTVVNIASNTPFVVNDFYTGSITGINAIDIQGQYLYATGPTDDAINIFDISNPEAPLFVSSITNGGASAPFLDNPQDIKVRGDYAYVASWDSNRVQVLDISDPENPIAASSITTGAGQPLLGLTKSITISGNYLFVTAESSPAMNILDISDPTNISAVGTFFDASLTWGGPVDVEVAGDYAYVSSATSDKIVVIDISDPSNPSLKGTINDGQDGAALNQPTDIEIHGNYLYVASASSNKLEILDIGGALISTAEIGVLDVDAINVNGRAHFDNKLTIRGGVEVANSISLMDGLFFNSAPSSTLSSTNTLSFSHRSLFSASSTNGYVFNFQSRNVLSDSTVLFRLQNSSTDKFTVLGNGYVGIAGTSTAEHALAVSGTSYISGTTTITNLLDVKGKILQPRFITELSSTTGAQLENPDGVFVSGDYAYVASAASDALSIIDISNPEETIGQIGFAKHGTNGAVLDGASEVFVSGEYAYVASLVSDALSIIDISQPTAPIQVSTIIDGEQSSLLNGAETVFVQGNYAYVGASASNAVNIIDVSDPYNPVLKSTISTADVATLTGVEDIYVSGKYAYVAASLDSSLTILDVSDPVNPREVGTVGGLTAANDVFVQGDFAYVTENASSQVSIVDVVVPSAPTIVGVISNGDGGAALSSPNRIFVSGDYAYVTSKVSDALEIIDISSSTNPVHVSKIAHGEGGAELDTPSGVYIRGNYAYVAADGNLSDALNVIDISGTRISNAEIGNVNVSALQVGTVARFNQDVHIRGGINTGGNSLFSGDLSITAATSSLTATSTVGFSHRAYFHSSSTDGYNFIFDTTNALASSSLPIFSVRNAGTPLLSLHANGNLRLDGNIYASSTVIGTPGSPGDLAEQVDVDPNEVIEPGDVLCVDPEAHDRYRKCRGQNAQDVAGVVSTNATIITGFGKTNTTAIMALVGRVPIKVTLENGPINRGDLLITASTTGYAMKYDPSKDTGSANISIIGLALDSYTENSSSTGKILGLVKSGWVQNQTQTIAQLQQDLDDIAENQGHNVNDNLQQLDIIEDNGQLHNLDTNLNLNNNYIINVAGIFGSNNAWKVDNNGRFVTNIETGNGTEETLYAVQSRDTEFVFSGSDALVDGERRITFNLDTKLLIDNTKPIKVSITLTDEANGVFVTSKDETGFTVKELANGESNATFDWVVIASRILAEDVEQNEPEEEPEQEDPVEEPLEEEQPPVEDEEQNEEQENQPPEENNEAPPEENPNPEQEEPPVEEPEQEEQNPEPPVEEPPVEEGQEPEQNEPEPDPVDDPPPQPEPPLEEPPEEPVNPPPEEDPLPEPEPQT